MDSKFLKETLVILLFVFLHPNEIQVSSYDFRLAIAMDSTKMTTLQEFKDQVTLVEKVVAKVMDLTTIEYAIAVYTADTNKIFKDFDNSTTINLSEVHYLKTRSYGFNLTKLFGLAFNARPDCLWFIRNSNNYTHPEGNSSYAPMGYDDPVTKIALRFGKERPPYLKKITNLTDLIVNGLQVSDSINVERNSMNIVESILLNCNKYEPRKRTSTPSVEQTSSPSVVPTAARPFLTSTTSAELTSSPSAVSSHYTHEIRMTLPLASLIQSSSIDDIPHHSTESNVASSAAQPFLGQNSSSAFSPITSSTSTRSSSGPSSVDRLCQEYEELLNYNVEQVNLSTDVEFVTFINKTSKLFKNIPTLEAELESNNVSYGWSLSFILEKFCIGIAETTIKKRMVGKTLEAHTDNLVVRISLVNITLFSGYDFGAVEVEKGTIKIPLEVFQGGNALGAIIVMIFDPVKPFIDGKLINRSSKSRMAGKIIGVDVLPRPSNPLKTPVTLQVSTEHTMEGSKASCVFWESSVGGWSTAGCSVTKTFDNITECQCNHMTHYSVLMSFDEQVGNIFTFLIMAAKRGLDWGQVHVSEVIPKKHHQVMTTITYIGCSLSIMGIFLTIITFFCLPVLKSERTRIHCNLCLAIGAAQTLFLGAGTEELTQSTVACKLYAAVMLYFFISVFTWMLVEGIHLYQMVIIAFVGRPMMKFYYALGWGFPAMIVIVATATAYKGYGSPDFCWISVRGGTIWAFTGPAACIILANLFVLISVLRLRVKLDISNEVRQVAKTGARVSIVLLPLLGITWIFGFFSVIPGFGIVFQYFFAITNSLQGLMVFVFHCVGNSEVRKEFLRKTAQWNFRKSFSSTNNTLATNKVEPISMDSYGANHKKD